MSRSYTTKASYANQSGARPRRRLDNQGILEQERTPQGTRQGIPDGQQDDSMPPQEPQTQENERYQRREAYTVIAPNDQKRQDLLRIQKQEEETARRRKEEKAKIPIKMTPRPVGGQGVSEREYVEHQQKLADKSPTAKALEMREKREKWRREKKEREEREIEEKKAAARLQAEKNEKKQSLQKETMRNHWAGKYTNQSIIQSREYSSRSDEGYDYAGCGTMQYQSPGEDELVQLCQMFPDYDPTMLSELLEEQGSLERGKPRLETIVSRSSK